jgi:DNA processing protein
MLLKFHRPETDTSRLAWLRLARTENVGPITFRQLLDRFGSPDKALSALPELAQRGGRKSFTIPTLASVEQEYRALEKIGGRLLLLHDPDYPAALAAIDDAPPVLTLVGDPSLLSRRCIGIVGARNASLNGRKLAEKLAQDLGQQGLIVASGLARGIDTAAHQASLGTGTIAALAGGVDKVYPEENRKLYEQIAAQGCVISDQPLGMEPRAQLFPKRNRLISGLSLGVVVVEAALQSGSLITARMALEQGREVFAVPGSPLDPRAHGPNDLIRQGAILTESVSDILTHIHKATPQVRETADSYSGPGGIENDSAELAAKRLIILDNLSHSPVLVDELIRQCQFSPAVVLTVLLELELAGRIQRVPGNRVVLIN